MSIRPSLAAAVVTWSCRRTLRTPSVNTASAALLARAEGLEAHALAVERRLEALA